MGPYPYAEESYYITFHSKTDKYLLDGDLVVDNTVPDVVMHRPMAFSHANAAITYEEDACVYGTKSNTA